MNRVIRLIAFLRPFWAEVLLSMVLGTATVAAGIGLLGTSADLIARAALQPSIAELQVAIVGVRFFGLSRAVFRYLERLASHSVNFRLLARLRTWFFGVLEPLAPARLWDYRSGDLLARSVADIDQLEAFYVRVVAPPVVAILVTIGLGFFTGQFDAALGWILAAGMTLSGTAVPALSYALSRKPAAELITARAALQATVVETLQGMDELLVLGQEQALLDRMRDEGKAASNAQLRLSWRGGIGNAAALVVSLATLFAVLWTAIPKVNSGELAGPMLAVVVMLALAGFEATAGLPAAAQNLESSLAAASRLFTVAAIPPAVLEPENSLTVTKHADLRVDNLTFAYNPALPPTLRSVSFDLRAGKRMALVGASGSGKTTLVHLLARFEEYKEGSIQLAGHELHEYNGDMVRSELAVVGQSETIFSGSLGHNLILANPQTSKEMIQRALWTVGLDDWIASLPEGLDTPVGEGGRQLSGGEKQRLAIARALLKAGDILILDEPTASLDAVNEAKVMERLIAGLEGRSLLFITHRLVAMGSMDEILVFDRGRIVERGTHETLLAKGGRYARLWAIQQRVLIPE